MFTAPVDSSLDLSSVTTSLLSHHANSMPFDAPHTGASTLDFQPHHNISSLYYSHYDSAPGGADSSQPQHWLTDNSHAGLHNDKSEDVSHVLEISGEDGGNAHASCSWNWTTNSAGEANMGSASCTWYPGDGNGDSLVTDMGSMHSQQVVQPEFVPVVGLAPIPENSQHNSRGFSPRIAMTPKIPSTPREILVQTPRGSVRTVRPGMGHLSLSGCAVVLGAAAATCKASTHEEWQHHFRLSTVESASAVTPLGAHILEDRIFMMSNEAGMEDNPSRSHAGSEYGCEQWRDSNSEQGSEVLESEEGDWLEETEECQKEEKWCENENEDEPSNCHKNSLVFQHYFTV